MGCTVSVFSTSMSRVPGRRSRRGVGGIWGIDCLWDRQSMASDHAWQESREEDYFEHRSTCGSGAPMARNPPNIVPHVEKLRLYVSSAFRSRYQRVIRYTDRS